MLLTANWADILDPSFREVFDQAYLRYPEQYSKVFSVKSSDRNSEKYSTATGFGMAVDVAEGETIPLDDPILGFNSTFNHKKIGSAMHVSSELYEDDLFSIMSAKPKSLAEGLKRKVENDAADIFVNANNTTNNTGADGVALASTVHPREDGS